MLKLHELKPFRGSTKRRKVVGRGVGSGHGTFSGRGAKGQLARSGASMPVGFEGGRMPLHRQIPKRRGFKSRRPQAIGVNLDDIHDNFKANETVNPQMLANKGLIQSAQLKVKILGMGTLNKALAFEGVLVSESAKAQIEKAGGKIIEGNKQPAVAK